MGTVLLGVAVFLGLLVALSKQTAFISKPTDTQVVEGRTATLNCVISYVDGQRYGQWTKGGKAISNNYTIHSSRLSEEFGVDEPSRYKIVGNHSRGEYNLQISNTIRAEDEDVYKCLVMTTEGIVGISENAQLSVASPSVEQYPMCLPTSLKPRYLEGDILSTTCIFRHAEPVPVLHWRYDGAIFNGDRQYTTLPDITRDWFLTHEDDGAVFTCEALSPSIDEPQKCEIGPVKVFYKPRVSVVPAIANVKAGSTVTFTCSATSNPPPSAYVWEINGEVVIESSSKYSFSESGQFFTITGVDSNEDGIRVTCLAANTIGLGVSTIEATLDVEFDSGNGPFVPPDENGARTLSPTTHYPSNKTGMSMDTRTLAIIVVAAAAGIAVLFSIAVLIYFRKTLVKCCGSDSKGLCWKAQKPATVAYDNRFSNIAKLSTMIAVKHKLEQLEEESNKSQRGHDDYNPYAPHVTIV
ncbi:kin of IRRE-like protein 1 [Glandiceps talaboti]